MAGGQQIGSGETHRLVEMIANRISQRPNSIVQDEEVLGLVLAEGIDQHSQDVR